MTTLRTREGSLHLAIVLGLVEAQYEQTLT